jgi:hypothetical protein
VTNKTTCIFSLFEVALVCGFGELHIGAKVGDLYLRKSVMDFQTNFDNVR